MPVIENSRNNERRIFKGNRSARLPEAFQNLSHSHFRGPHFFDGGHRTSPERVRELYSEWFRNGRTYAFEI